MIHFFKEDSTFEPKQKRALKNWISGVLKAHGHKKFVLTYIFCSDPYILKINRDFLQHDYFTDIITFDHASDEDTIVSDIFISVDRIEENAKNYQASFEEELHRVMIHGVLHLLGFKDKTTKQKQQMRQQENQCLDLRKKYYLR